MENKPRVNFIISFLFIGLAYFAASILGDDLSFLHKTASPVWPAVEWQ